MNATMLARFQQVAIESAPAGWDPVTTIAETRVLGFNSYDAERDWRNHVPSSVVNLWQFLSTDAQLAVFIVAQEAAARVELD